MSYTVLFGSTFASTWFTTLVKLAEYIGVALVWRASTTTGTCSTAVSSPVQRPRKLRPSRQGAAKLIQLALQLQNCLKIAGSFSGSQSGASGT